MDHVDDFWKTLKSETQKKKKKPLEVGSQSISAILEVSFKSSRMAKLPVVFTEVSAWDVLPHASVNVTKCLFGYEFQVARW